MEVTVSQKIRGVLMERNISVAQFAKTINMQQVTCNRQLKDEQPVSLKLLEGFLSAYPDVSAEWLLRNKGDKIQVSGGLAEKEKQCFVEKCKENEMLREMLRQNAEEIKFYRSMLEKRG